MLRACRRAREYLDRCPRLGAARFATRVAIPSQCESIAADHGKWACRGLRQGLMRCLMRLASRVPNLCRCTVIPVCRKFRFQLTAFSYPPSDRYGAGLRMPTHLRDQLLRASSSICLNLAEGHAKTGARDQRRFFEIAMGSLRETQTILFLAVPSTHTAVADADRLAASLYRLLNPKSQ